MRKHWVPVLILLVLLLVAIPVTVSLTDREAPTEPAAPTDDRTPPPVGKTTAPSTGGDTENEPAARTDPPPEPGGRTSAAEPGQRPAGAFPEFVGRVVDLVTGEPVAGAKILYGPFPDCWYATSRTDGAFRLKIEIGTRDPARPFRLRVTAAGYEEFDVVPDRAEVRVELLPETAAKRPGRIRGRALDSDGRPLTGVVRIVIGDSDVTPHYLAVLADENGEFHLESVPPGGWMIRHRDGESVNVFVPEDGEGLVTIRSTKTVKQLDPRPARQWQLENLVRQRADLQKVYEAEKKDGADAGILGRLLYRIRETERQIRAHRARDRRRRTHVVELPGPDGTRLVCESTSGSSTERWWAVVSNGTATFPALYTAEWSFTLKLASGSVTHRVKVPEKGDVVWPK